MAFNQITQVAPCIDLAATNPRDPDWPLPSSPTHPWYADVLRQIQEGGSRADELARLMCVNDFFFFVRYLLSIGQVICRDPDNAHYGKPMMGHRWLFERMRELQAEPNGYLDLWPRGHYKTALITQSLTLWDLIHDRELTFGILTYKISQTGESFLTQIKHECEQNENMIRLFPEVFFENPQKESPKWKRTALTFRRTLNPKEPTISIFGLVNATATSAHWNVRIYDDVVVRESVTNANQIQKTHRGWEESRALAADYTVDRYAGTRWHVADTYRLIVERGAAEMRRRDGIDSKGNPTLQSKRWLEEMKRDMGPYTFASQILNDPVVDGMQTFRTEWLQYYEEPPEEVAKQCNVYLYVDPCGTQSHKMDGDWTAMAVIGWMAGIPTGTWIVLDLWRDHLTLKEEIDLLFDLVQTWKPLSVHREKFGTQRDLEPIKTEMLSRGLTFPLHSFHEGMSKVEKIRRLQPALAAGHYRFPRKPIIHPVEGVPRNITQILIEDELRWWTPETRAQHDDLLDVLSWPLSPELSGLCNFPNIQPPTKKKRRDSDDLGRTAWSA